jgi:polysaccharide deacetylase family protein (PEP-CTERM system associated)
MTGPVIRNAMSVDVEEWFQVQAFANHISRSQWDGFDSRVEASTDRILARFAEAGIQATFFTLGWVAERHPSLVRRIVSAGHELASHGHQHELVHRIGEVRFRADILRAKHVLEDVAGVAVRGYRAPTFSVGTAITPWAHRILAEAGYAYSSSVFPMRHDLYGAPEAPRAPHRPDPRGVTELPMTTLDVLGRRLPCAGGGWFRLAPYPLFRTALRRVNRTDQHPGMFYFHPWEIDPGQPRFRAAPLRARFRHYMRQGSMEQRIARLLRDFAWGRVDDVFATAIAALAPDRPAVAA